MAADGLREVKVVLRQSEARGTRERAWMVRVDPSATLQVLLPELVETLPIDGSAEDFSIAGEGSLAEPVLVLTAKSRRRVGGYRELGAEDA